ncbi:MAG: hypothetical protein QMD09_02580, partial [Desulfatibacillaceae bacterium]|nr:hypothetical protein [Desulfatibacillaceae bacterium]
ADWSKRTGTVILFRMQSLKRAWRLVVIFRKKAWQIRSFSNALALGLQQGKNRGFKEAGPGC